MQLDNYIARLKADLEGARAALGRETLKSEQLQQERDEARANARVLAHSYTHDSRPPPRVVDESLAYPVVPERRRPSAWAKSEAVVIERKR